MRTLRDCIYGALVGDALGVPYEFLDRDEFTCTDMTGYGTHFQPPGTWSDDSSLLLATCKSLKDTGGRVDTADMLEKFRAWKEDEEFTPYGEVFDIGVTTSIAIAQGYGMDGEDNNGNGSLMRIAPLAFTEASEDDIRAVSAITHAHPISTEACVIFIGILRALLEKANGAEACDASVLKETLRDVVHSLNCEAPYDRLAIIDTLPVDEISGRGFVVSTLEASLWSALTTDSYRDCVLAAVNLGNDTDTTACVAGALAGILYGKEAIPAEWWEKIAAKELIEDCLF